MRLNKKEKLLIKTLQGNLGIIPTPYSEVAAELGWDEQDLLQQVSEWKKTGKIKRIGAILAHRKVGYRGNAMSVWEVPAEEVERVGKAIASFPEVSHCYERHCPRGWRHNVFAMIHARTRSQCRKIAKAISQRTKIKDYELLFTVKEFKKESPHYF